jgi:hypothetical protein
VPHGRADGFGEYTLLDFREFGRSELKSILEEAQTSLDGEGKSGIIFRRGAT